MTNPFKAALDSKLGRKLRGVSIVDNAANPASAYSKAERDRRSAGTGTNAQNKAVEEGIKKAYGPNSTVKVYGAPSK